MKKSWWDNIQYTYFTLEIAEEKEIRIYSKDYYSRTAIKVKTGEKYLFEVDKNEKWKDLWFSCDAKGFKNIFLRNSKKRLINELCFKLCGTIDRTEKDHFAIGLEHEESIKKTGDLHFFANDKKNSWLANRNNKGSVLLKIKRVA